MALIIELLNAGTIQSSDFQNPTIIFPATVPPTATRGVLVQGIALRNTHATKMALVHLQVWPAGGTSTDARYVAPGGLYIPAGGEFVLDATLAISVSASLYDKIVAWTDSLSTGIVTFEVSGIQRDQ